MFNLFGKKCAYCRTKIKKGKVIKREVKVPGLVGIHQKEFCSEKHADKYEKEVKEMEKSRKEGCCCG